MKPFLCVGYYADNLHKITHLINAQSAGDAELAFFQAVYDECGYANGACVGVFQVPAVMATKAGGLRDRYRDRSDSGEVNFGPSFDEPDEEDRPTRSDDEENGDGNTRLGILLDWMAE